MSELSAGLEPDDSAKWVTKSDHAYGVVRQAILAGQLEPKQAINPKQVANELGMSIIPVREALRRLEQDGLVVIKPHVGAAVREMPVAEIMENLLIRSALEALAAELAAPRMTPEVLDTLEDLMWQMDKCIADKRFDQFGDLNRQFHMTIYSVIAEKSLTRLIEKQWDQSPRGASVFSMVPEHTRTAQKEHALIFEALKRGDAEAAGRLTREHKLGTRTVHEAAFAKDSKRPVEPAL